MMVNGPGVELGSSVVAMPPYDPELEPYAAALGPVEPYGAADIADLRAAAAARRIRDADLAARGFEATELSTPGDDAVSLLVLRRPRATPAPAVILALHGGGWIVGDHRGRDLPSYLTSAIELDLPVVSVDYRLAPEHSAAALLADCVTGLGWVAGHLDELGAPGGRIVVAGGSAGGTLAAGLALHVRDHAGPPVAGLMLHSPPLDDRASSVSQRQAARLRRWDHAIIQLAWSSLLGPEAGRETSSPPAAPGRAADLSRLPPTYLDVGSAETLRDEVVEFAQALWNAGNDAELHVWPGAFHGWDTAAPRATLSLRAADARAGWLRRLLASAAALVPTTSG